jgi:Holliday junction resolvase RusA-like endonuclease
MFPTLYDPFLEFAVHCMPPVPWSAPQVFMKARKGGGDKYKSALRNPELEFWQGLVRAHAEEAMADAGRAPTTRPLLVTLSFFRATDDEDLYDTWWTQDVAWRDGKGDKPGAYAKLGAVAPDVDNLAKAALDAMQGVVFGNDAQVCALGVRRLYGPTAGLIAVACELD